MKFNEKLLHTLQNLIKTFSRKQKKAWSGLSILVFREDSASRPGRMRINYYVLFFFGLILSATPIVSIGIYLNRLMKERDPAQVIEGRRVILTNLLLMTIEKKRLIDGIEHQIEDFYELNQDNTDLSLADFIESGSARSRFESAETADSLARDIEEMRRIQIRARLILKDSAYHSLNRIWTKMAIHHILPRGRPLDTGIGNITSGFGYRVDPFQGGGGRNFHLGIDIAAAPNTPILATAPGVVIQTILHTQSGYGLNVRIHHGLGYNSLYAHCSKILVKEGDRIERGQPIALLGKTGMATGNHVHYEVQLGSSLPFDPMEYLQLR